MSLEEFPAGTLVRNIKQTSHDGADVKAAHGVQSLIGLLLKYDKTEGGFDRHVVTNCACYDPGACKLGKGGTLFGCHVNIGDRVGDYLIAMCIAHNGIKKHGNNMPTTKAFSAFLLPSPASSSPVHEEVKHVRADTQVDELVAHLKQMGLTAADVIKKLEEKVAELKAQ